MAIEVFTLALKYLSAKYENTKILFVISASVYNFSYTPREILATNVSKMTPYGVNGESAHIKFK